MEVFAGVSDAGLSLFERLLGAGWLKERRSSLGFRGGGGLFSSALTIWLGVRRRLHGGASVDRTWLNCTPEEALRLSPDSARARRGDHSPSPSGYDYARHAIPLALVKEAADRLLEEARLLLKAEVGWFLLDGSSLTLAPSPSLARAYPAATKKNSKVHWSVVKVAVAHELATGLAVRPEWGPMHGPDAVSEQKLALGLLERIPEGCGVIADRNFGIFSIAWAFKARPMLVRLTDARMKPHLPKGQGLETDLDLLCDWAPSAWDRRQNPKLPKDASIPGRFVIRHVRDAKGKRIRICLFTTDVESSAEALVTLYARRWNVETDLRSLKTTVNIELAGVESPEMLGKELVLSVAAFNLVRTLMAQAADFAGLEPRKLSFTRARDCIEAFARRGPITETLLNEIYRLIAGRPLPNRTKPRTNYERKQWHLREGFPPRKVQGAS